MSHLGCLSCFVHLHGIPTCHSINGSKSTCSPNILVYSIFVNADQLVARLVNGGKILPIVDGLDEIAEPLQSKAVRSLRAWGNLKKGDEKNRFIVTCRSKQFEEALRGEHPLDTASVVELQPVELTEAVDYLERANGEQGSSWTRVWEALREDPDAPLAVVLRSPLMIGLARTAYSSSNNQEKLLDQERYPTRNAIENRLIAQYLPRAYGVGFDLVEQDEARLNYQRARRYLPFIAKDLTRRNTRDIVWWQLHLALPRISNLALLLGFVTVTAFLVAYVVFAFLQHQDVRYSWRHW